MMCGSFGMRQKMSFDKNNVIKERIVCLFGCLPQLHHQHRCPSLVFHCGVIHDTHGSHLDDGCHFYDHFDVLRLLLMRVTSLHVIDAVASIPIDTMALQDFVKSAAANYVDWDFSHWHIHGGLHGYRDVIGAAMHTHLILPTMAFFCCCCYY